MIGRKQLQPARRTTFHYDTLFESQNTTHWTPQHGRCTNGSNTVPPTYIASNNKLQTNKLTTWTSQITPQSTRLGAHWFLGGIFGIFGTIKA